MSSVTFKDILRQYTHTQLKEEVKKVQIKGYSKMTKEQLIKEMDDRKKYFKHLKTAKKTREATEWRNKGMKPKPAKKPQLLGTLSQALGVLKSTYNKAKKEGLTVDEITHYNDARAFMMLYRKTKATDKQKEIIEKYKGEYKKYGANKSGFPRGFYDIKL